jgi:hypothetical protein
MLISGFVTNVFDRSLLSGARLLLLPKLPCGSFPNAPKSDCCNPSQSPADDPETDRPMSELAPCGSGDAQSIGGACGASQCGTSDSGASGDGADAGRGGNAAVAACVGSGASPR